MGLYLCVFDGDDELEGVEVGMYSDFDHLRTSIESLLENGIQGSTFPTLQLHSDCDGEWSPADCGLLMGELTAIKEALLRRPFRGFQADWQRQLGDHLGLPKVACLDEFIDVDGEPLLDRLLGLCKLAIERDLPILFQ